MRRAWMVLAVTCLVAGCPAEKGEPIETRYDNGQLKSRTETVLDEDGFGVKNGEHREWYSNGLKWKKGEYRDLKQHGTWTTWHENGKKWDEIEYRDGKLHGTWTRWRENGQKMSEGEFRDGKLHGELKSFDENGNPR